MKHIAEILVCPHAVSYIRAILAVSTI